MNWVKLKRCFRNTSDSSSERTLPRPHLPRVSGLPDVPFHHRARAQEMTFSTGGAGGIRKPPGGGRFPGGGLPLCHRGPGGFQGGDIVRSAPLCRVGSLSTTFVHEASLLDAGITPERQSLPGSTAGGRGFMNIVRLHGHSPWLRLAAQGGRDVGIAPPGL